MKEKERGEEGRKKNKWKRKSEKKREEKEQVKMKKVKGRGMDSRKSVTWPSQRGGSLCTIGFI